MQDSNRNLIAIWPGLFVVSTGLMSVLPMLPLYIEERYGITDPVALQRWSAICFGTAPLVAALLGPIWGGLGDRIGRKPMVLRAMLAIALVTTFMPFAPSPFWLAVMRGVQGSIAGYVAPAMALVSGSVSEARQGRTIARLQVALAAGMFCGPVLGAEIAASLGRGAVFYVCGALALVASAAATFARENRAVLTARPPGKSTLADLLERTAALLRHRAFAWLLMLTLLMRIGQNMIEPVLALFIRVIGPLEVFEKSDPTHALDRTTALAFTVLAIAQFVATPIWGRTADRFGPLRCLAVSAICLGLAQVFTASSADAGEFLVWRGIAAVFMAGAMTLAYAAATKRVAPTRRAMAFALIQSCTQLGLALGPMGGGFLAAHLTESEDDGLRGLFYLAGGITCTAGLGMIYLRRLPAGNLDQPVEPVPSERP